MVTNHKTRRRKLALYLHFDPHNEETKFTTVLNPLGFQLLFLPETNRQKAYQQASDKKYTNS